MEKLRVGVTGASGYAGIELMRILGRHPNIELKAVTSRSLEGKPVVEDMPLLRHIFSEDFKFIKSDPAGQAKMADIDVWFLALPHGVAAEYASALLAAGKTVLDLSADFRLGSLERYLEFYKTPHPAPELLKLGKYVIPELFSVSKADRLIACPGCYPTSILTPLIPLMRERAVSPRGIVIDSYSGVSGGGRKADMMYSYCVRNESMKAYGLPKHRHLSEIEEQLSIAFGSDVIVQFNPHLAPATRGISTTVTVPAKFEGVEEVYKIWNKAYAGRKFVKVLPSGEYPDTLSVSGTNRVDISAVYDSRTKNLVITSAIDNLVKGASGQAVQIMNIMFGFDESAGLL
ncbi:MAG: N-acetyl-gamma-glutamyl-phosphate reductase [Opitutales bacterium]|nr:N-acetyl-gamma-glutamyl-phosphate reductase [Opitutales bacterium]